MTTKTNPLQLQLDTDLDQAAAAPLAEELLSKRGAELTINANNVSRVGVQCLQVLLAAAKTWAADGQSLRIVHPSESFTESVALIGISNADLRIEGSVE